MTSVMNRPDFLMIDRKALTRVLAILMIVVVVAAAAIAVFTWQSLNPPQPSREIVIGASLPLTGAFGAFGPQAQWAYQRAVDLVNAEGGIDIDGMGKLRVSLIIYDDKSDPNTVIGNVDRLVSVDKVDFLLGSFGTPLVTAAAGEAEKLHVLMVTGGTSSLFLKLKGWHYVFIPFESTDQEVRVFLEMLSELPAESRPSTIAEWSENTALGMEFGDQVEKFAPQYGFTVVLNEIYPPGSTDFTDLITKTKAMNPDIVMGEPIVPDAITLLRQSKQLDFNPKLFYFERGSIGGAFYQALEKDAEYILYSFMWSVNFTFPGNKELVDDYRLAGQDPSRAGALGSQYAAAQILLEAISRARSLDTENIIKTLSSSTFDTVAGPIAFDEHGIASVTLGIFQWQGGTQTIVYPEDLATSKLVYPMPSWDQR